MENKSEKLVLKIKKINADSVIPERKTSGSAGHDLCACISRPFTLSPRDLVVIPTGIAVEIPTGYAGMIFTRSGLGVKHGIHVSNGVGVIDCDYRGELLVGLTNASNSPYIIKPGDRIAQLIIMPVAFPDIQLTDTLSETGRGHKGFGSTGE